MEPITRLNILGVIERLESSISIEYSYDEGLLDRLSSFLKEEGLSLGDLVVYEEINNIFLTTLVLRSRLLVELSYYSDNLPDLYTLLKLSGGDKSFVVAAKNGYVFSCADAQTRKVMVILAREWHGDIDELYMAAKHL